MSFATALGNVNVVDDVALNTSTLHLPSWLSD
jgi:hypothetical protein